MTELYTMNNDVMFCSFIQHICSDTSLLKHAMNIHTCIGWLEPYNSITGTPIFAVHCVLAMAEAQGEPVERCIESI